MVAIYNKMEIFQSHPPAFQIRDKELIQVQIIIEDKHPHHFTTITIFMHIG